MSIHPNSKHEKIAFSAFTILLATTMFSGAITASYDFVSAEGATSYISTISINVASACTMESVVSDAHSAILNSGTYTDEIGTTTVTVTCNNPSGYGIYAVGYGNNEWKENRLIGADNNNTIATHDKDATYKSDSHWYMKLKNESESSNNATIVSKYQNYSAVPNDYTKVAYANSATDGTGGSSFQTTYGAYITPAQVADTYSGKVKYTIVSPHISNDDNKPIAANVMQDIDNWKDEKLANTGDTVIATDKRDGSNYLVGKLADGNIWMLDNLALDLTAVSLDELKGNTNAPDQILAYLKNGGGPSPYASSGVENAEVGVEESPVSPYINVDNKNNVVNDSMSVNGRWNTGVYYNYCAASAGSYCYGYDSEPATSTAYDVCPSGWRMPTSGSSGEYQALADIDEYGSYNNFRNALRLSLAGDYNSQFYGYGGVGGWGNYWSSTPDNERGSVYGLWLSSSEINTANDYGRGRGLTVRCIVK